MRAAEAVEHRREHSLDVVSSARLGTGARSDWVYRRGRSR
jgi:hypothetical protein